MENNITAKDLIGEEYLNYNIKMREDINCREERIYVFLENNGMSKYFVYLCDFDNPRPMTNIVDSLYEHHSDNSNLEDHSISWSYEVQGKIRAVIGLSNTYVGVTYPIGYDLNTKQFINFPLNEFGLIDEKTLKDIFSGDDISIGFDKEVFKNAIDKHDLYRSVESFDIAKFAGGREYANWILNNLEKYNMDYLKEVEQMVDDKLEKVKSSK